MTSKILVWVDDCVNECPRSRVFEMDSQVEIPATPEQWSDLMTLVITGSSTQTEHCKRLSEALDRLEDHVVKMTTSSKKLRERPFIAGRNSVYNCSLKGKGKGKKAARKMVGKLGGGWS